VLEVPQSRSAAYIKVREHRRFCENDSAILEL
jgi:hypothetical protein